MADFKTAEQYVVEKLETTEKELENLKIDHALAVGQYEKEIFDLHERLNYAYGILNNLRDFLEVRYDSYFGNCIHLDTIYGKEHPELVGRIVEYFDIQTEEDE